MNNLQGPAAPFAEFGETETVRLTKIQKLTATYLARNWARIPHVTHHDEADVTALEAARAALVRKQEGPKVTSLAFYVKGVCAALSEFPKFNASLDESGEFLVQKKYFNIGIAIDTSKGLVVGVLKHVDTKQIPDIAAEIESLSIKARGRGLSLPEMSGGCLTISSLGRAGGTSFTPIINAPELAILGLSSLQERPIRALEGLVWRKMLPLSLSYDHRVINGADAAAFVTRLKELFAAPEESWTK